MKHYLQNYISFALSSFFLTSQAIACDPNLNMEEQKLTIYRNLNPGKGHTVWIGPELTEQISWYSFYSHSMQSTEVDRRGELEITISDCASSQDFQMILEGLQCYNSSRVHPCSWESKWCRELPKGPIIFGKNLIIGDLKEFLEVHGPEFMVNLEKSAFENGADKVVAGCEGQIPDANLRESFGLTFVGEMQDLEDGKTSWYYTKPLTIGNPNNNLNWYTPPKSEKEFEQSCFSICTRDSKGQPLGGIIGNFNDDAIIPYANVDMFFIDPSVRGTGLGRQVMSELDTFVANRGINTIILDTLEVQAPEFYSKMGYETVLTLPWCVTLDQVCKNAYWFKKTLKSCQSINDD